MKTASAEAENEQQGVCLAGVQTPGDENKIRAMAGRGRTRLGEWGPIA